jgi:hypothetical protein
MIVQEIFIIVTATGILTNSYYAGKGEYLKSRNACICDTIAGLILAILAIWFWNI